MEQRLASLWLQHPSDMHRGRVTPDTETHTHTHTRTCTHTHTRKHQGGIAGGKYSPKGAGGGGGGITYQREEENVTGQNVICSRF